MSPVVALRDTHHRLEFASAFGAIPTCAADSPWSSPALLTPPWLKAVRLKWRCY